MHQSFWKLSDIQGGKPQDYVDTYPWDPRADAGRDGQLEEVHQENTDGVGWT